MKTEEAASPGLTVNLTGRSYFDVYDRVPFEFSHNLHLLDMFQFDSLCELAGKFSSTPSEYNIGRHAPLDGAAPAPRKRKLTPGEAVHMLEDEQLRVLLKRPENQDERFRELLQLLSKQIQEMHPEQKIRRLESAVLISSASTTTPLHFDPEIGFFFQIEGGKLYHVYSPRDVGEVELEDFYLRTIVSVCRLDIKDRNPENEHVFHLRPGIGFHQPQSSPHWVETCTTRSVSYTVVIETAATRERGRTRAFNHYERRLGFNPSQLGESPLLDTLKAKAILPEVLARKAARRFLTVIGK